MWRKFFNYKFILPSHPQAGFTLLELVVTMTIIIIMATMAVSRFRDPQPQQEVERAIDSVHSVMELARTYAHTGEDCCATPAYGYGIHFTITPSTGDQEYIMYADLNNDKVYSTGDEIRSRNFLRSTVEFASCYDTTQLVEGTGSCDIWFAIGQERAVYLNAVPVDSSYHAKVISTKDMNVFKEIVVHEATQLIESL